MTYIGFLLGNRRLLAFGFLVAFFSSFGQTFFIALFSAELRAAYGLGHGGFGSIYGLATLTSAALMIFAGQLIDRLDLRLYSAAAAGLLAAACLWMAAAPDATLPGLYLALLLLRLSGQGLMSHTAVTAMARYFEQGRGRAIALASLGFAIGEAVLPSLAVALAPLTGWRGLWGLIGAVLAVGLVPLLLSLLRGHAARQRAFLDRAGDAGATETGQWTRRQVLRDRRFYLLLPAQLAPSFIITGIFFNQVHLVESKGWSLSLFAAGFAVYAAATVVAALAAGPLVDRLRAARVLPVVQLPLGLGLLLLAGADHPATAIGFMALAGLSTGAFQVATNAIWPEFYGQRHLGSIRATAASLMVFSTALSPPAMGLLIDAGASIEAICLGCLAWILVAMPLARRAGRPPDPANRRLERDQRGRPSHSINVE